MRKPTRIPRARLDVGAQRTQIMRVAFKGTGGVADNIEIPMISSNEVDACTAQFLRARLTSSRIWRV